MHAMTVRVLCISIGLLSFINICALWFIFRKTTIPIPFSSANGNDECWIHLVQPEAMMNVSKIVRSRKPDLSTYIPMTLYIVAKGTQISEKQYRRTILRWQQFNPDLNILWYDDAACIGLFEKYDHSGRGKNAFLSVKRGDFKADFCRYFLLFNFGGIYADSDVEPLAPLRKLFSNTFDITQTVSFLSAIDKTSFSDAAHSPYQQANSTSNCIWNGFMAATPYHPFMQRAYEDALKNIEDQNYDADKPLAFTGPCLLGRSINTVLGRDPNARFQEGYTGVGGHSLWLFCYPPKSELAASTGWVNFNPFVFDQGRAILKSKFCPGVKR